MLSGMNSAEQYPTSTFGILKQTFNQQGFVGGIKGLYGGYMCYMIAIMFWMSALPATTEFLMGINPAVKARSNKVVDHDDDEDD